MMSDEQILCLLCYDVICQLLIRICWSGLHEPTTGNSPRFLGIVGLSDKISFRNDNCHHLGEHTEGL